MASHNILHSLWLVLDSDSLSSMDKLKFKFSFQPTAALIKCGFVMTDNAVLSVFLS